MLGQFVNEQELRHLLTKTIEFFEVVAQDSSSLAVDLRILKGLLETLPRKHELQYGNGPLMQPMNDPALLSNMPTPHPVPGRSPHTNTNTPSDAGHPTPMDFS